LLTLRPAGEEVAAGADEVRVLVLVVTGRVDVDTVVGAAVVGAAVVGAAVVGAAVEGAAALEGAGEPEEPAQFPKSGLQPVPQ